MKFQLATKDARALAVDFGVWGNEISCIFMQISSLKLYRSMQCIACVCNFKVRNVIVRCDLKKYHFTMGSCSIPGSTSQGRSCRFFRKYVRRVNFEPGSQREYETHTKHSVQIVSKNKFRTRWLYLKIQMLEKSKNVSNLKMLKKK